MKKNTLKEYQKVINMGGIDGFMSMKNIVESGLEDPETVQDVVKKMMGAMNLALQSSEIKLEMKQFFDQVLTENAVTVRKTTGFKQIMKGMNMIESKIKSLDSKVVAMSGDFESIRGMLFQTMSNSNMMLTILMKLINTQEPQLGLEIKKELDEIVAKADANAKIEADGDVTSLVSANS